MQEESKIIKTSAFEINLENGIIYIIHKDDFIVDISISKEIERSFHQIAKGNSYPLLSDVRKTKYWTKDARDYQKQIEPALKLKAAALLVNSIVQKILINSYILLQQPSVPTKCFTDERLAIKWLENYKN